VSNRVTGLFVDHAASLRNALQRLGRELYSCAVTSDGDNLFGTEGRFSNDNSGV
jgi:hypothetical protein